MTERTDKRRSPRAACDLAVEYAVRGARTHQGRITNIGTHGTLITTQGPIPPVGADVLLRFHLPLSHRPVQTLGKVKWATPRNAGMEFLHLGLQEKDEIWRYYARESALHRTHDAWREVIKRSEPPESEPEETQ
ncbi:MAG: PilZ domain-containing protein [Candidatus Methylomirabilales bacterium]